MVEFNRNFHIVAFDSLLAEVPDPRREPPIFLDAAWVQCDVGFLKSLESA